MSLNGNSMPAQLSSTNLNLAFVVLGGLLYIYALLSRTLKERFYLSAPILAAVLGVIFGLVVLSVFDVSVWGTQELIVEQTARMVIAIQLISTALRLRSG